MKSYITYFIVILGIGSMIFLTGCLGKDQTGPTIYFYNQDTTVPIYKVITDPGIIVEDNKDYEADITVESDFEDEVYIDNDGRAWRTGDYEVKYKATDLAGNFTEEIAMVRVKNPSEIIANTYNVVGDYQGIGNIDDTSFIGIITPSNRYAGAVRFSKIYPHTVNGELVYLNIEANMYHPDFCADITDNSVDADEKIRWMGTATDPTKPFYHDMTYTETMEKMTRYTYLDIPQKNYADSVLGEYYNVRGRKDLNSGLPLSKIEFFENGQVKKITLKLFIDPNASGSFNATETYTVRL